MIGSANILLSPGKQKYTRNLSLMTKYMKPIVLFVALFAFAFQSCKKSRSDIGAILFKETKNKVFKKVDSAAYYKVFREMLEAEKENISNSTAIQNFYRQNEYEPYFIVNFSKDQQLNTLLQRYQQAPSHGLNPEIFNYSELQPLIAKLYDKKGIQTVAEAYQTIAKIELLTANSLVKYATIMKYGMVNPRKIFARYYMKTAKPDSAFTNSVLAVSDLKSYLDSIQPKYPEYLKLQQALAQKQGSDEVRKAIALNLERLRWQNKPSSDRYVYVNIASYMLKYVDNGQTGLTMKVCVGKGPEQEYADADYDESEGSVRPRNHTTPQLNSEIYNAQVNPEWNIPESIANGEIAKKAAEDPYYLANSNIQISDKSGNLVDADAIDWTTANASDYSFKQAPGEGNALGRIKFQFKNASAVYLHDTPAQQAFNQDVRAVSHGCVRLEQPMELARALYGEGKNFNTIQSEMNEANPTLRDVPLSPKVPVYLDYRTAFVDESGQVKVVTDVYRLDNVLYRRMGKALAY
ncbi:MAG: hypothetical protein K0S09_2433 [Sphingobacteriaceae bacterium]|jgi:murein L,D-transpeptidase YcbB/YkuD|nr:hypothetical protein [Sphingobacteriaceae bacterium]